MSKNTKTNEEIMMELFKHVQFVRVCKFDESFFSSSYLFQAKVKGKLLAIFYLHYQREKIRWKENKTVRKNFLLFSFIQAYWNMGQTMLKC